MSVAISTIATPNAPAAAGPYSQGYRAGDLIFTAGQVPFDPATPGKFVAGGIKEQTAQVLKNIVAILEAGGSDLAHVVKTTVFMADLSEFAAMNEVYAQFFGESKPARSTVQATLPMGARLEVDAIAVVKT
jgi:2-iminobutanoate/2-iminopropanoate deaminase